MKLRSKLVFFNRSIIESCGGAYYQVIDNEHLNEDSELFDESMLVSPDVHSQYRMFLSKILSEDLHQEDIVEFYNQAHRIFKQSNSLKLSIATEVFFKSAENNSIEVLKNRIKDNFYKLFEVGNDRVDNLISDMHKTEDTNKIIGKIKAQGAFLQRLRTLNDHFDIEIVQLESRNRLFNDLKKILESCKD